MENPDKLAAQGTQDEDKKTTTTTTPNAICVGHHYTQASTNKVNKTRGLLPTTGGKDEPNIVFMQIVHSNNTNMFVDIV